jgi:hypothetical protein
LNNLPNRLNDLVIEVAFWNETLYAWDAIYQNKGPKNDSNQFDMAFYPYEGNSTLLCHTLKEGLGGFGTKFRIQPINSSDLGEEIICAGVFSEEFSLMFIQ